MAIDLTSAIIIINITLLCSVSVINKSCSSNHSSIYLVLYKVSSLYSNACALCVRLHMPFFLYYLLTKSTGTALLYILLRCMSQLPWGFWCYEKLGLFLTLRSSQKALPLSDPLCPYHLSHCVLISKFLHLSDLILTVLPQVGDDAGRFKKEDEGSKGSHGALPGAQSNLHTTILTRYSYS